MKNILHSLFVAGLITAFSSAHATPLPDNLARVGQAKLEVLWFDIYKAYLYCNEGQYSEDRPCMLKVNYLRDISAEDLIYETRKQWQGKIEYMQQEDWLGQLEKMWPDIKEGDTLSFYRDEAGLGHFYFNQDYIGSIESDTFSNRFLDIWLAETSDYPKLARQLRGER